MVKAYPIDSKGVRNGAVRQFTDFHWNKMKAHLGKKLAWIEVQEETHNKEVVIISTKNAKKGTKKHE